MQSFSAIPRVAVPIKYQRRYWFQTVSLFKQIQVLSGDEVFHNRDVKDVVNLYQKRNDKIAFKEYIDTQKTFDRESIEVITEMVTSKELKAYMQNNTDNEGGNFNMCKAITDLIQDGRDAGKTEGKKEGKIETLVDLINDGDMTVEKAASKMQITEKEFCKQAEAYGFKIACFN